MPIVPQNNKLYDKAHDKTYDKVHDRAHNKAHDRIGTIKIYMIKQAQ